ncbi:putative enoyl-CoA hydratase [Arthrobacter sp. PAMC 25486]|uniref:crotonase/enoyl-CoA hydratase family protein n=1 Tax=Arthrobacter sp. PAMC 25486 TaxID=1494608 RepID=UPI0005362419|nr:crotonase/enoyl-CoA hydratase family protein [Arthrobacter sp. PAMC 25486]AIY01358.1 putative enoyl-CoA hydratase [Arthrobacter sp. PAMC 25486]
MGIVAAGGTAAGPAEPDMPAQAGPAFTHPWSAFTVAVAPNPGVAVVHLTGPGRGNMLGLDFWAELPQVFAALDADPSVRAVVLAGAGNNFSTGLDVQEVLGSWLGKLGPGATAQASQRTELLGIIRSLQDAISSVAACRKPVIAAVHGWCIGGGVDLISAADVRLASADAKFSIREARLAIVADVGSLQRLRGIIGEGHLRELALTAKDIGAERAEKIGLVNDVYADAEELMAAALSMAGEMAANSPLAVAGAKAVLNEGREEDIARGLRHVALWNTSFLHSEDLLEAVRAMGENRPGVFTGK